MTTTRRLRSVLAPARGLLLVGGVVLVGALVLFARPLALAAARPSLALALPRVAWIAREDLAEQMARPEGERPILVDVRTEAEFRVSHLEGAVRMDPGRLELGTLSGVEKGKAVVVYCSLGYRSALAAVALDQAGYGRVRNLDGGLFRWADEGRPMVGKGEARTALVHPYDHAWAWLVAPTRRGPMP